MPFTKRGNVETNLNCCYMNVHTEYCNTSVYLQSITKNRKRNSDNDKIGFEKCIRSRCEKKKTCLQFRIFNNSFFISNISYDILLLDDSTIPNIDSQIVIPINRNKSFLI